MHEQPPPQVPPIDRTVGYEAYLKVVKEAVSVDDSQNPAMPPSNVIMGFSGRSPRTCASVDATRVDTEDSAPAPAALPTTLIMDGPGGLYGPSFADPAPWACGGAPTPGCVPPPPPAIGGRR
ncbi:hypothetical protein ACFU7Z_37960 [Kitasatospora sp. NPDC057518]|uniref:hypothetical protein n=1 Tax=unclassified Kitasatospora TaxID=2633591 RepID=UPI0036751D1C